MNMKVTPVYFMNELLEEQLLYQLILYLPLEVLKIAGTVKLDVLVEKAGELNASPDTSPKVKHQLEGQLPMIHTIIGHRQDLNTCRMEAMSWLDMDRDGSPDYPEKGLIACAFINSGANTVSVVFRGTPAGAWMDNAKMLLGDKQYTMPYVDRNGMTWDHFSPMQTEAMHYITGVINKYGEVWNNFYCRCVTGHSKGGNQAQLTGMLHHNSFDISISVDGPGMSGALIQELKGKLGDINYASAADRLYGFNAANDYVHSLGESLIPGQNTIWVQECDTGFPLLGSHSLKALMNPETGAIMPFTSEPGAVANFISRLSAVAMELPADDRSAVFMSLMGFAQMFIGKALPVHPEHEDWLRFVADLDNGTIRALGIILCVLMNTQQGKEIREYLNKLGITEKISEYCDRSVHWYLKLPLNEKIKKAKGVAVILIMKVALLAVLTEVITMADIMQRLRESMGRIGEMGMAMIAAYSQLVSVLLHGYLGAMEKIREILQGSNSLP